MKTCESSVRPEEDRLLDGVRVSYDRLIASDTIGSAYDPDAKCWASHVSPSLIFRSRPTVSAIRASEPLLRAGF
jgi:hypothetical protein